MQASDSRRVNVEFLPTWTAFGHRTAVATGAGAALIALLRHVPVHIASLRGALAWLAVVLLFRLGRELLIRTGATNPELEKAPVSMGDTAGE